MEAVHQDHNFSSEINYQRIPYWRDTWQRKICPELNKTCLKNEIQELFNFVIIRIGNKLNQQTTPKNVTEERI
ncbi:hypothetical protein BpHYR1_003630 [Brachionus plicatilis]|uniref:Uncharacterized protein n=1 Tax=Brachionus plicatilis TaxID=10195 RepID=A0A3M7PE17_BRAPC|nr:hypothetical protein BpHYR1_003630 [Brachionus plicatilis]